MNQNREPYPGELDKLFLERHVDALKDELAMEREAHRAALARNAELRRDSDRMDWLETQDMWIGLEGTYEIRPKIVCGNSYKLNVRDAIDDAMGQRQSTSSMELLRAIASRDSDDHVLANLIAGIRHGLALADAKQRDDQPDGEYPSYSDIVNASGI